MEVKYETVDEEYEMVESATESLKGLYTDSEKLRSKWVKQVISLFDRSAKVDDTVNNSARKYDHLPQIITPKILQTPQKISALYSFNRTSVYLLMSADTCQKTPKAVILHAMSEHGPLELEIPVQDVGIGETLHQLAARKATQELEEGRGWITEARGNHGQQLKTKFKGRWDEMIEREAVRLDMQYQIENKWCSFVAVQKTANSWEELPGSTRMRSVQPTVFVATNSLPAPPGASPSISYSPSMGATSNGFTQQYQSHRCSGIDDFIASPMRLQQSQAAPERYFRRELSESTTSPASRGCQIWLLLMTVCALLMKMSRWVLIFSPLTRPQLRLSEAMLLQWHRRTRTRCMTL